MDRAASDVEPYGSVASVPNEWQELAAQQNGLVTTAQLRRLGVSERRVGAVGGPCELVRLRHGVLVSASVLAAADDAGRAALAVAAERLRTRLDLVAVGMTAAAVHGLPVLGRPGVPTLAERKQSRPQHHGRSRLIIEAEIVEVAGVPVTSVARTAADVARGGFARGLITVDAALRRGVTRDELQHAVDVSRRWPGRLTAEAVVARADPLAESALESLGRARFLEHDLPVPDSQVWIGDAKGAFARVDHCWPEHRTVAEADGAVKYAGRDDLFQEKRREDRLRDAGWEVVRYTWDDALRHPHELAARVRRAFERHGLRRAG